MPLLIEHIDEIARRLKRDVLYVEFHSLPIKFRMKHDYENDLRRQAFLDWLDKHSIAWTYCFGFHDESLFESYLGQVYIDLPMDEYDPSYCLLRDRLENPDGSMRDENVRFFVVRLKVARRNANK